MLIDSCFSAGKLRLFSRVHNFVSPPCSAELTHTCAFFLGPLKSFFWLCWLPWLSDVLGSRHVRFLSPSCLLVKLHFLPFLFSPFSPIISSTLPGSCFHPILLLIFRFLCQTCLLFFKIFQYGKDTGTSQRQQKY